MDYYGVPTPIQQAANISVPEARMIQIQPWEKSMLKEIEKAILMSDIGINPTNDGTVVRLMFPELTEERRKELVKDVKKKERQQKLQSAISVVTETMHSKTERNRDFRRRDQRPGRFTSETDRQIHCRSR